MPGRFCLLLVVLSAVLCGCAAVSEERIALLESAVLNLQARDMRLASLEDTVAALVAKNALSQPAESTPGKNTPPPSPVPREAQTESGKTIATPSPAPERSPQQRPGPAPAPAEPKNPAQAARLYQAALSTLEAGRPGSALGQFQEFLRSYPGHALAPNAGYWLGECYYGQKQYDSAISAFKDVVALHPGHDKAAAAMLKAGYCYALLGDAANARFYLEALIKDFPASQPALLARARLAAL